MQARVAPYLFVAPFVVLFLVFLLYPLVRSLVLSFYDTAGPRATRFVGMENYRYLLTDRLFWGAVANTAYYTVAFVAVQIPLALGLAVLLNSPRVKWRNFLRFAFFSTHLVGHVFVAVLFALLLSPRGGLLNEAISFIARRPVEINWLGTPSLAMPAILLAAWWVSTGYAMIYLLAALQAVDKELYEAAEVDGAGKWRQFVHVTLPGIRPVLTFLLVVGVIGGFQLFELPYVLFGGPGPNSRGVTIVMYLFIVGWEMGNLGYASAVGWMLVVLIAGVSIAQLRVTRALKEDA
jgi:ABC-type sugar transport system permease subunit